MRFLRLFLSSFFLLLLIACEQAPEPPAVSTELVFVYPWAQSEQGLPVFKSLDTRAKLSFSLAQDARVSDDTGFQFILSLNGAAIDLNHPQVRFGSLGSGGEILFEDLTPLTVAIVDGVNTLRLSPISGAEYTEAQFIFYDTRPELVVTNITSMMGGTTLVPGDFYQVSLQMISALPIGYRTENGAISIDDSTGLPRYAVRFFDKNNQEIEDVFVSPSGKQVDVILDDFPDFSIPADNKPDLTYEVTDITGQTRRKALAFQGRRLKNDVAVQLNRSFFDNIEMILNPMFVDIVDLFIEEFPRIIEPMPRDNFFQPAVVGGPILAPPPFSGTESFLASVCENFLTRTPSDKQKLCAFYASIDPISPEDQPKTNLGFDTIVGENGQVEKQFVFDIVIPKLSINIDLAAYEPLFVQPGVNKIVGNYFGSYRTTIVFENLALRDRFILSPDEASLIGGMTQTEGFVMRHQDELVQSLVEAILNNPDYSPMLTNSSCPGDVCIVPASFIELVNNLGGAASRLGLIDAMETGLNAFLPVIIGSLVESYPDVNQIKAALLSNENARVTEVIEDKTKTLTMSADAIRLKDLNPLSVSGIGRDMGGLLQFSGAFEVTDSLGQPVDFPKLIPFRNANQFNELNQFAWGRYVFENEIKKELDMVVNFSANSLNQWLAAEFDMEKVNDWLSRSFTVDVNANDLEQQTLSLVATSFNGVLEQGDQADWQLEVEAAPIISLTGEQESNWQYSYSFLFGLFEGGASDDMVTPAIKITFPKNRLKLIKTNGGLERMVFDVEGSFSIEANIGFENGLPKLYITTPQAPQAQYEDQPEQRFPKRLMIQIEQINFLANEAVSDPELESTLEEGVPIEAENRLLAAQISNAIIQTYLNQTVRYTVNNQETFLDYWIDTWLSDNFTKVINFQDYRCDGSDGEDDRRITIIESDEITLKRYLFQLYGETDTILMRGVFRFLSTDESGGFVSAGLDFSTEKIAGSCPNPMPPMAICLETQSLNGRQPACKNLNFKG